MSLIGENDNKQNVHIYNAIVSQYNPQPLFIPKKTVPNFLDLKIDENITLKQMKIFDINKTFRPKNS